MSKFRKIILAVLISCFAVCAGLAVAACTDKSAVNFRKPAGFIDATDEFNGVYTLSVQSAGGMGLNGVKVDFRKGNTTVATGISKNGTITMPLEPDVYQLVVDASSLPEGYYLDGTQYYTEVDNGKISINIPSRVIASSATSNTLYSVGDVMYDFSITEAKTGKKVQLSDLLNGGAYKAVMLNFFYIDCNPCKAEFPAIESAYASYKDKIAIIALSYQDSNNAIKTFAEDTMGLTFDLGYDSAGLTSKFNVSAFPTTVIVDRYGVVATVNTEGSQTAASYWRTMFNYYTSDNYDQRDLDVGSGSDDEIPLEFTRPTAGLEMPSTEALNDAVTGKIESSAGENGATAVIKYYEEPGRDKEYSWPWSIEEDEDGSYISAANAEVPYSFATLYVDVALTPGDAVSYEYNVLTEAEIDILYVFVNNSLVTQYSGNSEGWQEELAVYVANRNETVTLAFMYYKDPKTDVDDERVWLRNLNVRPVRDVMDTIDQSTLVVNGLTYDEGMSYPNHAGGYNVAISKNEENGYYYYTNDNNKKVLLLADILNAGYWSEKHMGAGTFTNAEGTTAAASVYHLSFWTMSNYDRADKTVPLSFSYLNSEQTDFLIQAYYLQQFSDNGYVPVTDELIDVLNLFINAMHTKNSDMLVDGDKNYEGQWLEFCYYFVHYGEEHDGCFEDVDPVAGLTYENAFTANMGANDVNINKILNFGDGGGVKFKFVPEETGVYLFYSEADTAGGVDPQLYIFASDKQTLVAEGDNDMRYNSPIYKDSHDEYFKYVWLEGGETYYIHGALAVAGSEGSYVMNIEYIGTDTVSYLRYATTGDGVFTYDEGFNNYYLAVNVAYDPMTNKYYHYTADKNGNYSYGSPIYIDFIHNNYFDHSGQTLYQMIEKGVFDFSNRGGNNYTATMRSYYRKSVVGKTPTDELYGLLEADELLVSILSMAGQVYYEEGPSSGTWEMFACYYEYIGSPNA